MKDRNPSSFDNTWCLLILALYGISFLLPALGKSHDKPLYGYAAFLWGLYGVLLGIPVWLANLALWFGLGHLALGQYRGAAIAGIIAVGLGLTGITLDPGFLIGYYLWMGSMALLAAVGLVGACTESRYNDETVEDDPVLSRFRRHLPCRTDSSWDFWR